MADLIWFAFKPGLASTRFDLDQRTIDFRQGAIAVRFATIERANNRHRLIGQIGLRLFGYVIVANRVKIKKDFVPKFEIRWRNPRAAGFGNRMEV